MRAAPRAEGRQRHRRVDGRQPGAELVPHRRSRHHQVRPERVRPARRQHQQPPGRHPPRLQHTAHGRVAGHDGIRADLAGHPRRRLLPRRGRRGQRGLAGRLPARAAATRQRHRRRPRGEEPALPARPPAPAATAPAQATSAPVGAATTSSQWSQAPNPTTAPPPGACPSAPASRPGPAAMPAAWTVLAAGARLPRLPGEVTEGGSPTELAWPDSADRNRCPGTGIRAPHAVSLALTAAWRIKAAGPGAPQPPADRAANLRLTAVRALLVKAHQLLPASPPAQPMPAGPGYRPSLLRVRTQLKVPQRAHPAVSCNHWTVRSLADLLRPSRRTDIAARRRADPPPATDGAEDRPFAAFADATADRGRCGASATVTILSRRRSTVQA